MNTTPVLKAYFIARHVNPDMAFDILNELSDADDKRCVAQGIKVTNNTFNKIAFIFCFRNSKT